MAKQEQQGVRVQGNSLPIDHTPVGALVAGEVVRLGGNLVGITDSAIAAGRLGAVEAEGIFRLSKDDAGAVNFAVGDTVDWDDAADEAVVAGDFAAGVCTKVAANGDDNVEVWINKQV